MTQAQPDFVIRPAVLCDLPAIKAMHADALRGLTGAYYDDRQINAALGDIGTVDPALVSAGTYFAAVIGDEIIGSGGWGPAGQLLGAGTPNGNDIGAASSAAAIRAIFVCPKHAGKGIARAIMAHVEWRARMAGHETFELLSTLNALPFYVRLGYRPVEAANIQTPDGPLLPAIKMIKGGCAGKMRAGQAADGAAAAQTA